MSEEVSSILVLRACTEPFDGGLRMQLTYPYLGSPSCRWEAAMVKSCGVRCICGLVVWGSRDRGIWSGARGRRQA